MQIHGQANIPETTTLVLPGRLDFQHLLYLEQLFSHRKVIWLCTDDSMMEDSVRNHLDRDGVTAAAFSKADQSLAEVGQQIASQAGEHGVIIFIPSLCAVNNGTNSTIPEDTIEALCALQLPVLALHISVPSEVALATESTSRLPSSTLSFASEISSDQVSAANWYQALLLAGETSFRKREVLNQSLGYHLLAGLKKHGSCGIFDGSKDSNLEYYKVLGVAIALSKQIKESTNKKRVGIILPPGHGGLIANLAVIFAGKIPVNLNFTASKEAVESAMNQADLDRFVTADPFVRKMPNFPWPPTRDLIFIERSLPHLKKQIKRWVVLAKLLPLDLLAKILAIPKEGGEQEAVLLFTSGSSGEPKGVPLSHRNVLANVCQFGSRLPIPTDASILGCLPLFHSFGCTVTLWFPIIFGINIVSFPSPIETKRLAELIHQHKVDLLVSTPTFLRGYMRRVEKEQLQSLKAVVTGAEKLPESLASTFEKKFGIRPQEGYGLTETSPGTNLNIPNPIALGQEAIVPSNRNGSVGNFLPGIAVKLTDAGTDQPVEIDQSGIIWLKGSNIFSGYLNNQEKTDEVLVDHWFKTGDVGRVDANGFLYIEGRISRFSKIGGEMVPHETLEAAINTVLGLDDETERRVAVTGIPDERKGEVIVLLSTLPSTSPEQECIDLRYKLLDQGIPSLWCPKQIVPVEEIPILASGKLDIKGCETLAKNL